MSPTAHQLPVQRTAHFYSLGEPGPQVKRLWFVCHGYGQLASTFIRKFDQIAGPEDYVIAPEGLSRFYWGGLTGKVAASWMTSADRLDEIADYTAMLSTIFQQQRALVPEDVQVMLFGFSQGCATVVRWMLREQPDFDQLWLWAGQIPEDVSYDEVRAQWNTKNLHAFAGKEDPLITPERIELHRRYIAAAGLNFQEHNYDGDHRVLREALAGFARGLIDEM